MKSYRTYSSILSANHRKTPAFSALTHRAKNLYNVASFYIRNAYSASIKSNEDRFPHEIQVLEELNGVVDELNVIRQKHHSTPFHIIDHDHRFVSMQRSGWFFKLRDQIDYRALSCPGKSECFAYAVS